MAPDLFTALSGIESFLARFDNAANNLSNLATTGFRSSRVDVATGPGGRGVVVAGTRLETGQGPVVSTDRPLDVSILGDTFFRVDTPDGELFTRNGGFRVDSEGFLVTAAGHRIVPPIHIPPALEGLFISRIGEVTGVEDGEEVLLGRLESVRFNNTSGLRPVGDSLFERTPESGEPVAGNFGDRGFGELAPGTLEGSNTDIAGNVLEALLARRFIQAQAAVIGVEDELLAETVNLGRSESEEEGENR